MIFISLNEVGKKRKNEHQSSDQIMCHVLSNIFQVKARSMLNLWGKKHLDHLKELDRPLKWIKNHIRNEQYEAVTYLLL